MDLKKRLKEHLEEALAANPDITDWFMIAVNGSWNYNLQTENSDVDSKLLVIPSFDQLIDNKIVSYTHICSNGEHVDVKDIRSFFRVVMKQNINFVETFFAIEYIVNPKYQKYWNLIVDLRETIAHCNPKAALNCMLGMMVQKKEQMFKYSEGRKVSINCFGYDLKSFHHFERLFRFIIDYTNNRPYIDCLRYQDGFAREWLIDVKTRDCYQDYGSRKFNILHSRLRGELETARCRTKTYLKNTERFSKNFSELEKEIRDILNNIATEMIKESLHYYVR